MNRMKYIIVEGAYDIPTPYIFSETVQHNDLANQIRHKVLGAGFVIFTPKGLSCWGESVSLNIKSRGQIDTDIINRELLGN